MEIKYLSPTTLMLFQRDPELLVLKLQGIKEPQTLPMAVGSAFDHLIKAEIIEHFGLSQVMPEISVDSGLYESAMREGANVLDFYRSSGAFGALLSELSSATGIFMEGRVAGVTPSGVPIVGVPDLIYVLNGVQHILDWKVNGWLSSASPKGGYYACYGGEGKYGTPKIQKDWNLQLSTYSWLVSSATCGATGRIEQITRYVKTNGEALLRSCSHKWELEYDGLDAEYSRAWDYVKGIVVPDITPTIDIEVKKCDDWGKYL